MKFPICVKIKKKSGVFSIKSSGRPNTEYLVVAEYSVFVTKYSNRIFSYSYWQNINKPKENIIVNNHSLSAFELYTILLTLSLHVL